MERIEAQASSGEIRGKQGRGELRERSGESIARLAREKDTLPRHAAQLEGASDGRLVGVQLAGVDQAVSRLQGGGDDGRLVVGRPSTESDDGHRSDAAAQHDTRVPRDALGALSAQRVPLTHREQVPRIAAPRGVRCA